MPTGYTAEIAKGITFEKFAMECARAFGACIMLRDEPMGVEIPEFEPSDYHAKAVATAEVALAGLRQLTAAEADGAALTAYLNECEARATRIREKAALRAKYAAMLEAVNAWEPPTQDHIGLRDFMRKQVEDSIDWDCSYAPSELAQMSGAQWLAERIAAAERDVKYHAEKHAEELERTASRNAWVKALRSSLKPTPAP